MMLDKFESLILAAEDYSPEEFSNRHCFSKYDRRLISKLAAHGPVLLRGGRGSGKSALMIEASQQLAPYKKNASAFGVYISLRHLGLLRSEGKAYESLFFELLISRVQESLKNMENMPVLFDPESDISSVQTKLSKLSIKLKLRVVLLFDDAAHIGRETSLEPFFDIFRTLSSSTVSCKAAIYPGVTQFGKRFDVCNDATVLDISRNEELPGFDELFADISKLHFATPFPKEFAGFLGQAVLGNMRAFIFACNELFKGDDKINLKKLGGTLLSLCNNYYWPLLEELTPKMGKYEPMIDPAIKIADIMFRKCGDQGRRSALIHRDIISKLAKPFEVLEYAGFISRRDASRAMKSGGRGSRFVLSLCVLLENTSGTRLTKELFQNWTDKRDEPAEFHRGNEINAIKPPELSDSVNLSIIKQPIGNLKKSDAYPYGLTDNKINLLLKADLKTIGDLVSATDNQLLSLHNLGSGWLRRVRNVAAQAIWM
ncbi:MAG: hypothetical protein DRI57_00635 [Deltaproteobacteria bacterium]|nr:MAG: hypothetical protein DRI57_00635 [Deltaproteobacteria bacterium]